MPKSSSSKMFAHETNPLITVAQSRFWPVFLWSYFIVRPLLTITLHAQLVLPTAFYPEYLVAFHAWYCGLSKDPLLTNVYPWFQSLMLAQLLVQTPYELHALWCLYKGEKKYIKWLPVYAAHVLTCILPAVFEIAYGKHYGAGESKFMVMALAPKLYDAICVLLLRKFYIRYPQVA